MVDRQYPLPEYQPIYKEQRTEKASCRPLWAKKGDAVHIPAAEKAAQDAQVKRVEQQKCNRYVVKHRTKQLAFGMADAPCKCRQQVCCAEGCQRTYKAEDSKLHICHVLSIYVDLNAKSHKPNLLKHAGEQGIQQMCTLMNEVVGGKCCQNTDVLSCSF